MPDTLITVNESPAARLCLASRSPRRVELLRMLGVDFEQFDTAVDESRHTGEAPLAEAAFIASIFLAIGLTSAAGWTAFGAGIRRFLSTDARLRAFNIAMGALVALSAVYILIDGA